jgi:hypothetical protein
MPGEKQLFAPLPLRAMRADLSGLQMSVLTCVAAHDRLSLVKGKGQGCRASNERMREMIGCSYGKLCAALSDLTELGFLQREKLGRHTIYRVTYTDEDRCLFGHTTVKATCDRSVQKSAVTCDQHTSENVSFPPESGSQYIPLNGVRDFVETREDNSSEEAHLAARIAQQSKSASKKARSIASEIAQFERRFREDWTQFHGNLHKWVDWLTQQHEELFDEDVATARRAERLADEVQAFIEEFAFEHQRDAASI